MAELLEVVADAIRAEGGRARTVFGELPEPASDTVYVIVPHEYLVLTPDDRYPSAELCARSIGFCVEHPGTNTFERSTGLVGSLAAAVDIHPDAARELARRGITAEHYQLGHSPRWDAWGGVDQDREIDVVCLGTAEPRRSRLLGSYMDDFADLRCRLLTPPHEMMNRKRVDFLPGRAKHELLANSRFLLNLHRESKRHLEWVRTLEAMSNGAVVVSESSSDYGDLVPGEHLVFARPGPLGAVVAGLAADPRRESRIRQAAYEHVRAIDSAASARMLMELADTVSDGRAGLGVVSHGRARALAAAVRSPEDAMAVDTPSWDVRFEGGRTLGPLLDVECPEDPPDPGPEPTWLPAAGPSLASGGEVDVILVRRPGEPDPDDLCRDLLAGSVRPARILVCEDGVRPGAGTRPWDRLIQPVPVGRGAARNALLAESTAGFVLVLDGGMRVGRQLIARLTEAVGSADVAHCPCADPVHGLVGALPPEDRRLRVVPYLGAGYLVRRSVVDGQGGWVEDPRAEGLADHVFWRRVVRDGIRSSLVQQVLIRRGMTAPPPRPVDVDPATVWSLMDVLVGSRG